MCIRDMPNNRILWHVNSYTTDDSWPDYKVQTTYWDAEDSGLVTEDSDKMFYEMEEKRKDTKRNVTGGVRKRTKR